MLYWRLSELDGLGVPLIGIESRPSLSNKSASSGAQFDQRWLCAWFSRVGVKRITSGKTSHDRWNSHHRLCHLLTTNNRLLSLYRTYRAGKTLKKRSVRKTFTKKKTKVKHPRYQSQKFMKSKLEKIFYMEYQLVGIMLSISSFLWLARVGVLCWGQGEASKIMILIKTNSNQSTRGLQSTFN